MENKLLWVTDPHLNFLNEAKIKTLAKKLLSHGPTAIVISGDISEAPTIEFHLRYLEMHLNKIPVYFCCGNHDYYGGSIVRTRELLKSRFGPASYSRYLQACGVVSLTSEGGGVALIGHDGWYDGNYPQVRSWFTSKLDMSDYHIIEELSDRSCSHMTPAIKIKEIRYERIQALAKEGADYFKEYLPEAFKNHDKVFLTTHVAPFQENSLAPDGTRSDRDWMPHFSSRHIGEAILDIMQGYPAPKELVILCGHTHTKAVFKPLVNVTCITGPSEYYRPRISEVFDY